MRRTKTKTLQALLVSVSLVLAACGGSEDAGVEGTDAEAEPAATETAADSGETEAAADTDGEDVSPDLIAAAEEEGEIKIFQSSFGDPNMWSAIEAGIKERWGIDVSLRGQEGPSVSKLVSQLTEEHKAGQPKSTDVFKASSLHTVPLGREGAIIEVDWPATCPWVTEDSINGETGSMVMGAEFTAGIMNTDLIPPEEAPETYEDLTDPRFEGLLATTPYAGHWPQIGVAMGGVDKLIPILEEMSSNGNVAGFIALSDPHRVAAGEFGILVPTGEQDVNELIESGAPVQLLTLGRHVANTYMYEIMEGTSSPNLAKLVGCFIMTREGQDILYEYQTYDSPWIEGNVAYERYQQAIEEGQEPLLVTPDTYLENPEAFEDFADRYGEIVGSR